MFQVVECFQKQMLKKWYSLRRILWLRKSSMLVKTIESEGMHLK